MALIFVLLLPMITTVAIEPRLQFRSKSIVCYNMYHPVIDGVMSSTGDGNGDRWMTARFMANAEKLKSREKYTGQMSKGAKKRLSKAVSLLVQSSPRTYQYNPVTQQHQYHQLSFITLTLPDVAKSKDAAFCHKHLLQPMLRIMRNRYKMKSYVWKCELQKNGSCHYHITTELFIEWTKLKQEWNAITRSHGMLDGFKEKYGHDNPNSIDVHSVNSVKDLEAYLIEYVSKEYQNDEKLAGKVWGCSKNLKQASYFSTELDFKLHRRINEDIVKGWCRAIYADKCVILKYKHDDYYVNFSQDLINEYYSHLTAIVS